MEKGRFVKWEDLEEKPYCIPYYTVGIWMDMVEGETGVFPKWDAFVPDWVLSLL